MDYQKQYRLKNKERISKNQRRWKKENKELCRIKSIEWANTHKEQRKLTLRKFQLKKFYGLSIDQFQKMLSNQNNCCALCSNEFKSDSDTSVDHNHTTGNVRQLLCKKCNFGIGMFNEDVSLLSKAINYINKWDVNKLVESNSEK